MCAEDVTCWFLENGLLLNSAKTETVLFGTSAQRKKVLTASGIDVAVAVVPFRDTRVASRLTRHWRSSHWSGPKQQLPLPALRHIRPLLTFDAATLVWHSIVSFRLDYANALHYGTSAANIHRLQVVQNSLARVICQVPWSASGTELLQQHSFSGFQFENTLTTNWQSSPTKREQPLLQSTSLTWSMTMFLCFYVYFCAASCVIINDDDNPGRCLRSHDKLLLTAPRTSLALSENAFIRPLFATSAEYKKEDKKHTIWSNWIKTKHGHKKYVTYNDNVHERKL